MSATRYRCNSCGNLTRFDVTATRRTRAFHHYSVGGELEVEDVEVLSEAVEDVSCRWCGSGQAVVVLDPDETDVVSGQAEPTEPADRGAGGPG